MTAKISAAVIDVFRNRNDIHDADWFFTAISNGTSRELDPTVQILVRRCLEFRRIQKTKDVGKGSDHFCKLCTKQPGCGQVV